MADGDVITTHVDMVIQHANGQSHVLANETQMTFVSADCGDVKPPSLPPAAAATPSPSATPPNPSE